MRMPTIGTPVGRWAGFGPYYAMFPISFAFHVVREFCPGGGSVFDPFSGRGSSIYAAAAQQRSGLGIELNPVGWIYSKVKLNPAPERSVLRRLHELNSLALSDDCYSFPLPEFFQYCYTDRVLRFLLTARSILRWRSNQVDATLMAIILVHLHAKAGSGLSNQMRQSKAMSPAYAVGWWREHGTQPPDIDPVMWLEKRVEWRYSKGLPELQEAGVWLGDSARHAGYVSRSILRGQRREFNLLFTSPPYFAVTNYQYDQWLRLWMLGSPPKPVSGDERNRGRFESKFAYQELLQKVFTRSARLLDGQAVIYVRTDAREFTRTTTEDVLRRVFPQKQMEIIGRPYSKSTQTSLFGDNSDKPGEVDIILTPARML